MTTSLSEQKAFVNPDDTATLVCPVCKTSRMVSVKEFRSRQHLLKIRCKCGHQYKVHLEFRRYSRKPTDLDGLYETEPPAISGGKLKIINLSLSGACFEVRGKHDLEPGQRGSLVFTLDNRKASVLTRQMIIKSVNKNRIGCEFIEDRAYDKDLGFYLLP
jgi:hypothetical protein